MLCWPWWHIAQMALTLWTPFGVPHLAKKCVLPINIACCAPLTSVIRVLHHHGCHPPTHHKAGDSSKMKLASKSCCYKAFFFFFWLSFLLSVFLKCLANAASSFLFCNHGLKTYREKASWDAQEIACLQELRIWDTPFSYPLNCIRCTEESWRLITQTQLAFHSLLQDWWTQTLLCDLKRWQGYSCNRAT